MKTIVDYLTEHAQQAPHKLLFSVLEDGENEGPSLTNLECAGKVHALASSLSDGKLANKRVLLVYQDILEFIVSFLACNCSGIIPVPVPYARGTKQVERLINIISDARTELILCSDQSAGDIRRGLGESGQFTAIEILTTNMAPAAGGLPGEGLLPNPIAFIQYTSGSTGTPKGVVITHENLLNNQEMIRVAFGCDSSSVIFSWLPFHHDMGLIGNILHTIYTGCRCVLMSPFHFIQKPKRWLMAISKYKVTHSGGPNFAYELCLDKIDRKELREMDLSSWRVAFNGSEPVRVDTIQRFASYFAPAGFKMESFRPCYGLAEATLFVTGKHGHQPVNTVTVERGTVSGGKINLKDENDPFTQRLVSSGQVALGMDVKIVSEVDQHECPELEVGEITISGKNVSSGYWEKDNGALFLLLNGRNYMRTGDLGFFYKGEMFVYGRSKEVIIWRGRNFYPYDIEQAIADCHGSIESNGVAVFRVDDQSEEVVIVVEIRRDHINGLDAGTIIRSIDSRVKGNFGIDPMDVILTTPLGIPRTTSGKIRRVFCRDIYKSNGFSKIGTKTGLALPGVRKERRGPSPEEVIRVGDYEIIRAYLIDVIESKSGPLPLEFSDNTGVTEAGIDSLRATEVVNVLNREMDIRLEVTEFLEEHSFAGVIGRVGDLLKKRSVETGIEFTGFTARGNNYPASNAQMRMWALCRTEIANIAYNITTGLCLKGPLIRPALERAFQLVIKRHESLRTVFEEDSGELRQTILNKAILSIGFESFLHVSGRMELLKKAIDDIAGRPFDLLTGPLFKVALFELSDNEHALIICIHHIISDGQSVRILIEEVMRYYNDYRKGETPSVTPPELQYKEYTGWLMAKINRDEGQRSRNYWRSRFSSGAVPLDLPTDFPRPATISYEGAVCRTFLDPGWHARMLDFCREHRVTLFNFLRTAITLVLYKYTGQKEITIGVPFSGRSHPDLEKQIGLYINTLPLQATVDTGMLLSDYLAKISRDTLLAFAHQDYPFDRIVEDLAIRREISRNPLFDIMLVLQDAAIGLDASNIGRQTDLILSELDDYLYESPVAAKVSATAKFDLTFQFSYTPENRFYLEAEYSTRLFKEDKIRGLMDAYLYCIRQMIEHPGSRLGEIKIVSEEEKHKLLVSFNDTGSVYPEDKTIVDMFEEQVMKSPHKVAIESAFHEITYSALNETVDRLAEYLSRNYAIAADDLIGIKLQRDEWMVIAMLAVLKAGAAYVAIDPDYPKERVEFIVADSQCKLVLGEAELTKFKEVSDGHGRAWIRPPVKQDSLAYVIYTSGSTGRPKGVMIEHRNVSAFIFWCLEEFGDSAFDVVLGITSICFDLSVFEIFFTLISGKRLRLLPSALSMLPYLSTGERILVNTVPSVIGMLLKEGADLSRITVLNMAGEPVPAGYMDLIDFESTEIRNLYGPTEDTTYSTVYRLNKGGRILIGRPVANTRIYILDEDLQVTPMGGAGEICIGGAGLARGYLNRPDLTREKFIENPWRKGERIYKTGDTGRWLPDGNIEYLGRKDAQVKIRGYRIEPGEIEVTLQRHPAIHAAVVIARSTATGEQELVAYVTINDSVTTANIRSYLQELLPLYMVPGHIVCMSSLPLLPNGKIDKAGLPEPDMAGSEGSLFYMPARNPIEAKLLGIWEDVLGKNRISVTDDFFDLGGHSLKAIRIAGRIHQEFEVRPKLQDLFDHPTPEGLACWIENARKVAFTPIPVIPEQVAYPLSAAQRRLYVLSQLEGANRAYLMPGIYMAEGQFDHHVLEQAFHLLIRRHEALRTRFLPDQTGEIKQFVATADEILLPVRSHDLRNVQDGIPAALAAILVSFDMQSAPLLRMGIFRVEDRKWIIVFIAHHIICDGWSMDLLVGELMGYYNGGEAPAPLRIHYKDYAAWQQKRLEDGSMETSRQYWLKQLAGELPVLDLGSKPRPAIQTYNGGSVKRQIPPGVCSALQSLCRQNGGSLFMGLVTALNALLHRYTHQSDILVGTPIAGRQHIDLKDQIGLYINTLVLRTRMDGQDSFNTLFNKVRQVTLEAYEHAEYPFDELINELSVPQERSRNGLFDVMVVFRDKESGMAKFRRGMTGSTLSEYPNGENSFSKFDLTFEFIESDDGILLSIEYNSDLFVPEQVGRLQDHFASLTLAATVHPSVPIRRLNYLSDRERHLLLKDFNGKDTEYAGGESVSALFERQCEKTPDRPALIFEEVSLSYWELNERANQLGRYLDQYYGIREGDLVGVMLDRGEWLVIALLAVLKSGAAYIPVDPTYPQERIGHMTRESGCKTVIDKAELSRFMEVQAGFSCENLEKKQGELVYVIYTSGSSGKPKGAKVKQQAFVNLLTWYGRLLSLEVADRVLLMAPISFDLAQKNIFAPLICGACLCVSEQLYMDYPLLADTIFNRKISVINAAPSAFYPLLDKQVNEQYKKLVSLRHVVLGGEPIAVGEIRDWIRSGYFHGKLINSYGPTECTDVVCAYILEEKDLDAHRTIPIGTPVDNCKLYILDPAGEMVPIGVPGEIFIGGICVGAGYIQPEHTGDKFVPDPLRPGEKMYKTGDLGRWFGDGSIEFIGRKDDQIKIRGFRVEPGEVEATLKMHPDIGSAVVIARVDQNGDKELVAYLVGAPTLKSGAIQDFLGLSLPAHMIPGIFIRVGHIPLTPSGKVDKRGLTGLEAVELPTEEDYIGPRNEIERKLASIWEKVLDRVRPGIAANFFFLGGHSLKLMRLSGEIYRQLGVSLTFTELFSNPLLEQQARLIEQAGVSVITGIPPAPYQDHYPLSPSQRRIWVLSQFEGGNIAYNISGVYQMAAGPDPAALEYAFQQLIRRHESLRTSFREVSGAGIRQFIDGPEERAFHITLLQVGDQEELKRLVFGEHLKPFDLEDGMLIRVSLYDLPGVSCYLCFVMHHIVSDGWSMEILIDEIVNLYNAYVRGEHYSHPVLRIQYKDFVIWQEQQLQTETLARHKEYWLRQLSGELPVPELPADKKRPMIRSYNGGKLSWPIKAELSRNLRGFSPQNDGTLFMTLLAGVNALLYHYTSYKDIIIGSPVTGREHIDLEAQIGVYINMLALRTQFSGGNSWRELFGLVRQVVLDASEHQVYPFDELIGTLKLKRDTSRHPLFDVMIILEDEGRIKPEDRMLGGSTLMPYEGFSEAVSKMDLTFVFKADADDLKLAIEYNSDIYLPETIERLGDHLIRLFEAGLKEPDKTIAQLDMLSHQEREKLLSAFTHRLSNRPDHHTIDSLISGQASKTPEATAIAFEEVELTYRELEELSGRVGHYLQLCYGVGPGDLVGVRLDRNEWLIIVLLGVLKSGAAYVPIDPEYPQERVEYMLSDSQCKLVFDMAELQRFQVSRPQIREVLRPVNRPSDLAYIIYTSGSTGLPKGVMIEHRNTVAFIRWCQREFADSDFAVVMGVTSVCFDLSIFELFFTLSCGRKIRLLRSALFLPDYLTKEDRILLNTVPSVVGVLLREGIDLSHVTVLNMAGEPIPEKYILALDYKATELRNLYGPTEYTTYSTVCRIRDTGTISIGQPVDNTRVYILDEHLQLKPIGVMGEICIGGAGLARGYLNKPEMTAERFIMDPYHPGERIYKTGDLGYWTSDGNLLFAGRKDNQVKARGYRIELNEIEAVLQTYPTVESAVVVVHEKVDGDKLLLAYLISPDRLELQQVKAFLTSKLPVYMIPNRFAQLDQLPLTPNGKIDRKKLSAQEEFLSADDGGFAAARNGTEERLLAILKEILGREGIGIRDNFFELGGHSLKAIQLISSIGKEFSVRISMSAIFNRPTIEDIGSQIDFMLQQERQKKEKDKLIRLEL